MYSVVRNTEKAMGEHGIKWRSKTLLELDQADDLSILNDKNVSNVNKFLEVRVQGAIIGLKKTLGQTFFIGLKKIVKKTKLPRLGTLIKQ